MGVVWFVLITMNSNFGVNKKLLSVTFMICLESKHYKYLYKSSFNSIIIVIHF